MLLTGFNKSYLFLSIFSYRYVFNVFFIILICMFFVGDNDSARNIKAIKNGELLYDSKRILACSVLINNEIFFAGIVSAAMKNKVSCLYIHVHVASVRDLINACNILSLLFCYFILCIGQIPCM